MQLIPFTRSQHVFLVDKCTATRSRSHNATHSHTSVTCVTQGSLRLLIKFVNSVGVQKAKGQPILRVTAGPAASMFKFATIEDREAFLAVMNPLKDAAAKAAGPPPAANSVIPAQAVQAKVFEARPELKAIYERCATFLIVS